MTKDWQVTVVPAYGKDYKTADDVWNAWMKDKDFRIMTPGYPGYLNKQDAEVFGVPDNVVRIRFNQMTLLLVVKYDKVTRQWSKLLTTEEEEENEDAEDVLTS